MTMQHDQTAPELPAVTITYTVNAADFRDRGRVIVSCVLAGETTMSGVDPNISLEPLPGLDCKVRIRNATTEKPVRFAIAVRQFNGTRLHPTGIILRQANIIRPVSFVGAWKRNDLNNQPVLILSDNGMEKLDYEFDLLIRDADGLNYAILDPRLTNS